MDTAMGTVTVRQPGNASEPPKTFTFDSVFDETTKQVSPIAHAASPGLRTPILSSLVFNEDINHSHVLTPPPQAAYASARRVGEDNTFVLHAAAVFPARSEDSYGRP
eukprot:scaffold152627_cov27-Tisochrysis_lutea.AAC.1